MCIYRLKYLQVKEVGNVVKIVSLTVFHSLKHLWQGHFYFTFSVFWWPEFRWQKIIRLNLLVFSFVWCQDHINYFGSAANLLLKSTSKMISWNRSVLVWWSIYWKATPTYHLWRCSHSTCGPGETCSSASRGEGARSRYLLLAEELPFGVSAEKRQKNPPKLLNQYLDNVESNQTRIWKEMTWFGILEIPIHPRTFSPFLPSSVLDSSRTWSNTALKKSPFGTWTPLYLMSQEHLDLSKKVTPVKQ